VGGWIVGWDAADGMRDGWVSAGAAPSDEVPVEILYTYNATFSKVSVHFKHVPPSSGINVGVSRTSSCL
jgi:hypothetical protein